MRDLLIQQISFTWIFIIVGGTIAVILLLLLSRWRRRHGSARTDHAKEKSVTSAIPAAAVPSPAPLSEWASLDRRALEGRLSKAMRQGKDAELPMLYLALADRSLVNHEQADAEEFLRKAILGATAADQKTIHARARVTLGDLAHGSGDLTTACEHWQIARGIFLELSRSADQEAVERRMQRNGCPTDWVLTEF